MALSIPKLRIYYQGFNSANLVQFKAKYMSQLITFAKTRQLPQDGTTLDEMVSHLQVIDEILSGRFGFPRMVLCT